MEEEKEVGDEQGPPFIRELSECTHEGLFVAAAENVSCQDPKGRPVQMPEYSQ